MLQRMNRDKEERGRERERKKERRQGNDQKESSCGRHLFSSALTYNLEEFIFLAFPQRFLLLSLFAQRKKEIIMNVK